MRTKAQQMMIDDGAPAEFVTKTTEERRAAWAGRKPRATISFADPKPVKNEDPATKQLRKEVAAAEARKKAERLARLKELNPKAKKAATSTETAMKTKTSKKPAAAKKAKAKTPAKKAAKAAPKAAHASAAKEGGVRPGSKLEAIVGLLKRPEGCTTAQVLAATGWAAVSMPQQAKAAGLDLAKEKVDGVTVYRAA